ncbi:MAG: hypothetical protein J6R88_01325 [Clostridia bacterium]|nr:hypothetical protein [Clostridia bacterium]
MKKKILSFLLTFVMLFSAVALTACDPEGDSGNETTLGVVVYAGDWGDEWLYDMKTEFEKMFKDVSFEDGKQGVKINIKSGKDDVKEDKALGIMTNSSFDLYFTTLALRENVSKFLDITDVVTNTQNLKDDPTYGEYYKMVWNDEGETGSIADKLNASAKDLTLYATSRSDGSYTNTYVAIPMYSSFYNMAYDVDLFYERGYYLNDDGDFIGGKDSDVGGLTEDYIDSQKSAGQDGLKGTADDGLPITIDDFRNLCEKILDDEAHDSKLNSDYQITPIGYSTEISYNLVGYFNNFHANYEGANDWYINVTGQGTDKNGNVYTLAEKNAYLTANQEGRLYALKFAEEMVGNGWIDDKYVAKNTGNEEAQKRFILSKYKAAEGPALYNRVAMFIDGGWWENGAKETLESLPSLYGDNTKRRFGVMTYPRYEGHNVDADGNNKMVVVSGTPNSNVFIRKEAQGTPQEILAKLFLVYTTTQKNLSKYTAISGSTRPYTYALDSNDTQKYNTSYYKQQLYKYYVDAVASDNLRYVSGASKFSELNPKVVETKYGVVTTGLIVDGNKINAKNPIEVFEDYSVDAETYFNAFKNYYTENAEFKDD